MRIVFMGTPDFAVPSLEALLKTEDEVVGVVSQPDRPKGRGRVLAPSPVKAVALREKIPLLQPLKMKDPVFLEALRGWRPDLIAVAAFGRILPPVVLQLPPYGCINVHASLLPKYRGAGPIQWALINGEQETGITTMRMDEGMDTGDILLQEPLVIEPEETAGELAVRLAAVGGRLLVETLKQLKAGTLTPRRQDAQAATLAPLLKKEDGLLDWTLSAVQLVHRVRGLTPWPGAYTYAGHERWTLWRVQALEADGSAERPGKVLTASRNSLTIATGAGRLAILELQPANGKRLSVAQFLAGHRVEPGLLLGPPPSPRASE